ncbi:glycoside hydrolase family 26 protein [Botryobasidium botryosum FD-172 SS1]|uniref:Glycoside hydrolase family 26 protein n=1 Tax=Botryobasidium botryosum (strain FD-172 SS1) TaxID=930990 RepID=A0A067MXT2_BOTB1|nr:glycoside hydrolase family 26 protein [Botryobasidium botryosum FD-172 SS1]
MRWHSNLNAPTLALVLCTFQALLPSACAQKIVLEAEDGVLSGTVVESSAPGFSGKGYVSGFDEANDKVTVSVTVPSTALYDLSIGYSSPFGDKEATVLLNNAVLGNVAFNSPDKFASASAGRVLLNAGVNTLSIQTNWGWYYIDNFVLSPSPAPPPHKATGPPVNKAATSEASSLLKYIQKQYGSKIISGQQEAEFITWLEKNVGKAPAIGGFDLIDYSPSRVERGTTSHAIEDALAWDKRGGIVAFAWHWNAPSGLIDQPGKEWWRGFYTDSVTFDIAKTLANKNGTDYALILRDIDAIATQLKRLQTAKVPVLFRPLHEANGGWFWWGAKGPAPAKELYRLVYDRLTKVHKLNNLIWVWNSANWYPGADVADIVSYDSYPTAGDHGPVSANFEALVALGNNTKVVGLAEVGTIPDPDLAFAYYAKWAFFVTWNGEFITDGKSNSLDFLKRVYNHKNVITLDKVGKFKTF